MRRIIVWSIILLPILFSSCNQRWSSEDEENAFWDLQVLKPAYEQLNKGRQLEPALKLFDSLLKSTHTSTPLINSARFALKGNYYYFLKQDYKAVSSCLDSALALLNTKSLQVRYPRAYVGYLLFGGEMAFRLSNYEKANDYYFLAKQSADLYLSPCDRSGFTYNVAMVSYRQQNYAQSAAYFKEAYASHATCPIQTTAIILQQQEIQSNIGLCQIKLKQYDSALAHFNLALQISEQYKDSLGPITMDKIRGVIYGNIGKIYFTKGDLKNAEDLFKKSIALNARPGYELTDAETVEIQLADIYRIKKCYPKMRQILQFARKGLDTIPNIEAEEGWRRLMYSYYKDIGQSLSELNYFKSYVSLRDSLADTRKQLIEADITRQLKDKAQELQITVLKKDNQLGLIYLWVAIALSGMAAIIILLIYLNYRRSKKNLETLTILNDKVTHQKAALEKANSEKDRILYVVAHDLRNPIGITAYVADLIMMEKENEKDRDYLQMIKEASQQALTLTNELLGLQNNTEHKSKPESTDLTTVVTSVVHMLHYKAVEKAQQVLVEHPGSTLTVIGYPERLNRMVSNLIMNAIKFTPKEGKIKVSLEKEGTYALLKIEDNGVGIPKGNQAEVFNRFTTARRKGTNGERSIGLGLSICKQIVEEHEGSIYFESNEGEGTVFYIRLPL
jgi:signal transduction histidine kinase